MKFKLKKVSTEDGTPVTIAGQVDGRVLELDPESGKKYLFIINLGNVSQGIAAQQAQVWGHHLRELLGSNNYLICTKMNDNDAIQVYELESDDETTSEL